MISPQAFYDILDHAGVSFFVGVPDSLLKEFCAYVDASIPSDKHIIAANEGTAVAIATGVHLANGKVPLVYLQNSGLGNAVNPLLSLADPEVYAIPMIVMIGWRGEPGEIDEPQHMKQGRVTEAMLHAMEIPFRVLTGDVANAKEVAAWATSTATRLSQPVVLLVRKGVFSKTENCRRKIEVPRAQLSREAAISSVTSAIASHIPIIATTGMISRELYEQRSKSGQSRGTDFLTVGSMGHASQIALGISLALPDLDFVCLDGDGAMLMHMGGMSTIGACRNGNLLHVVLNNGVHDSVGGQPTAALSVSLTEVATACGYTVVEGPVFCLEDIAAAISRLGSLPGHRFLEIRVRPGGRADVGRPKESPLVNKQLFVSQLRIATEA